MKHQTEDRMACISGDFEARSVSPHALFAGLCVLLIIFCTVLKAVSASALAIHQRESLHTSIHHKKDVTQRIVFAGTIWSRQ